MRCLFCGDEAKMSREHVFPEWLGDVIPGAGRIRHRWFAPEGSESEDRDWTADALSMTAKIVCEPCNTGWMHRLEESARPFLESMIRGRGRHLYAEGSRQVAYWALKTALTTDRAQEAEHWSVPDEDFAALYEAEDVLPGTFVWLGSCTFGSGAFARHWTLKTQADDGTRLADEESRPGFGAVLVVGFLVILVFRVALKEGQTLKLGRERPVLARVWPEADGLPIGDRPRRLVWPVGVPLPPHKALAIGEFVDPRPVIVR